MTKKTKMEDSFLGAHLGSGLFRDVYVYTGPNFVGDPLIIKVAKEEQGFESLMHNYNEWQVWQDLKHNKNASRWLAPVFWISTDKRYLLQAQTKPLGAKGLPSRIPYFLTDLYVGNYGLYRDRVVAHDYAYVLTGYSIKFKKANWRA